MLCLHKDGQNASEEALATLLSSSDHSDIVTLDSKEPVHVEEEEEGAASEELYLGTSCSSQYTFTTADTGGSLCLWFHQLIVGGENIRHFYKKQHFLYVLLQHWIRFDVESLEISTEPSELGLPSETSAH